MLERAGRVGLAVEDRLLSVRAVLRLTYAALKGSVLERDASVRLVVRGIADQIYVAAVRPIGIYVVAALAFGFVGIVQADRLLSAYSLQHLVPSVIVVALIREVGPIVIALILIGRTGTAIASELGYMRVNRETDALSAMGVNLDYALVLPRLIGITTAACCLAVVFAVAAVVGGFAIGALLDLNTVTLSLHELVTQAALPALGWGVLKAGLFGLIIAAVSCETGLTISGNDSEEVPLHAGKAVAHSLLACLIVNAALSIAAVLA